MLIIDQYSKNIDSNISSNRIIIVLVIVILIMTIV